VIADETGNAKPGGVPNAIGTAAGARNRRSQVRRHHCPNLMAEKLAAYYQFVPIET